MRARRSSLLKSQKDPEHSTSCTRYVFVVRRSFSRNIPSFSASLTLRRHATLALLRQLIFPRNVTEFSYRYASSKGDAAHIIISFQGRDSDDVAAVVGTLNESGYPVLDMQNNELGKTHVRHLAGGRSPGVGNERLFRFEFPEQPGALSRFLESLNKGFNCSLFHYRNHGDDFGRVLVGIQTDRNYDSGGVEFQNFLDDLGYSYVEETNNPARARFL